MKNQHTHTQTHSRDCVGVVVALIKLIYGVALSFVVVYPALSSCDPSSGDLSKRELTTRARAMHERRYECFRHKPPLPPRRRTLSRMLKNIFTCT